MWALVSVITTVASSMFIEVQLELDGVVDDRYVEIGGSDQIGARNL